MEGGLGVGEGCEAGCGALNGYGTSMFVMDFGFLHPESQGGVAHPATPACLHHTPCAWRSIVQRSLPVSTLLYTHSRPDRWQPSRSSLHWYSKRFFILAESVFKDMYWFIGYDKCQKDIPKKE